MKAASAASVVSYVHEAGMGFTTNIISLLKELSISEQFGFQILEIRMPHHFYIYIYLYSAIHVPLSLSVGRFVITLCVNLNIRTFESPFVQEWDFVLVALGEIW